MVSELFAGSSFKKKSQMYETESVYSIYILRAATSTLNTEKVIIENITFLIQPTFLHDGVAKGSHSRRQTNLNCCDCKEKKYSSITAFSHSVKVL